MSVIINIIRTIKLWQTRVYAAATAILGRTNYDIEHCVKTYVCGVKKLVKDKPDPRVACFHQNNCFQVRSQVGQNAASKSWPNFTFRILTKLQYLYQASAFILAYQNYPSKIINWHWVTILVSQSHMIQVSKALLSQSVSQLVTRVNNNDET